MIPAAQLRKSARAFLQDARVLLAGNRYDGAAYLCGYAVELALKARICRALNWPDYPDNAHEFRDLGGFRTHDLDLLLRLAGREKFIKTGYLAQWSAVAAWKPESPYGPPGDATAAKAQSMISAAELLLRKL